MAPLAETSGNGATSTRDAIIASIRAKRDAPPGCVIIVFKDIVLFDSNMPPTSNLKRDREAAVQRSRFFDALFTDIDPDSGRVIHGVESFDLKGKNMLLVDAGEMDPKAFFGAIGDMSHLKTMTNFAQRRIDAVDKLKGAPMSDEEKTNLRLVLLAGSPLAKPTDNGANYGRAAALLAADILPASAVKQMLAFLGYRVEADLLEAKTDITGLQLTAAAQAARMGKTEADVSGLKAQINQVSSTANAAEAKAEEARQAAQTASAQAEQFSTELASETAARKQGEQATEAELQKYGALMEELTAHVEGDKEAWEKKAVDFERNIARAQAELAQGKEAWEKKMAGFGKKVEAIKTETRGKFNVANSVLRATDNRLMAGEQQHGELSEQCAQLERQVRPPHAPASQPSERPRPLLPDTRPHLPSGAADAPVELGGRLDPRNDGPRRRPVGARQPRRGAGQEGRGAGQEDREGPLRQGEGPAAERRDAVTAAQGHASGRRPGRGGGGGGGGAAVGQAAPRRGGAFAEARPQERRGVGRRGAVAQRPAVAVGVVDVHGVRDVAQARCGARGLGGAWRLPIDPARASSLRRPAPRHPLFPHCGPLPVFSPSVSLLFCVRSRAAGSVGFAPL